MEITEVRPTRMELLKTKSRIRLAKRGLELLKLKRSSLILEFFKMAKDVKGMRADLVSMIEKAMTTERLSELMAGRLMIENTAFFEPEVEVGIAAKNVMGVRIPEVQVKKETSFMTMLYEMVSLPTSLLETREQFSSLLNSLLMIAEKEISLRKLLQEIDRTKRRTNSIENVLIPRLVETSSYIRLRLDEMDRETFITLKMIKDKMTEKGVENIDL
ncbi:MAG: V-type ATP synthase subunit D [Thermoplasmatales archaeon]